MVDLPSPDTENRPRLKPEPLEATDPRRYTGAIARTGHLRASDADREQVAERLRAAAAEGRIDIEELEERLTATLAARTYADLDAVLADLPPATPVRRRSRVPATPGGWALVTVLALVGALAALVVLTALLSMLVVGAVVFGLFAHHTGYRHSRRARRPYPYRHAHPGRGFWL